jgi:hypothetical protein
LKNLKKRPSADIRAPRRLLFSMQLSGIEIKPWFGSKKATKSDLIRASCGGRASIPSVPISVFKTWCVGSASHVEAGNSMDEKEEEQSR